MKKIKRALIMAAGTGGHVFPGLAIAKKLQERGVEVAWLGTKSGIETRCVPQEGIYLFKIDVTGLRGKRLKTLCLAPFKLLRALSQCIKVIRTFKPDLVIGMGGYVGGPGGVAARLMGKTLVIHEQNKVAGLTNRYLAPFSKHVFEAFPNTFKQRKRTIHTGNPVRGELLALPAPLERFKNREAQPIRLLVVGGSLGAAAFNDVLPGVINTIQKEHTIEVRHQTGIKQCDAVRLAYGQAKAHVEAFIEDMAEAYAWADLVLCRSGALTVSELASVGLGSILVPYPYAVDDHQTKNAEFLEEVGAAKIIQQSTLTPNSLIEILLAFVSDRAALLKMAVAARSLSMKDATGKIVDICLESSNRDWQPSKHSDLR